MKLRWAKNKNKNRKRKIADWMKTGFAIRIKLFRLMRARARRVTLNEYRWVVLLQIYLLKLYCMRVMHIKSIKGWLIIRRYSDAPDFAMNKMWQIAMRNRSCVRSVERDKWANHFNSPFGSQNLRFLNSSQTGGASNKQRRNAKRFICRIILSTLTVACQSQEWECVVNKS